MDAGSPRDQNSESEQDVDDARGDLTPDSRGRLVAAAVELVLEHFRTGTGMRDVFDYLTPRAVAERAGLTRGLIYHYWGDAGGEGSTAMARFLDDVSVKLWEATSVPEDLTAAADLLPDNFSDVIVALTSFEMQRMTGPDKALMRSSQALTINGTWPAGEAERVTERLTKMYDKFGEKLGREPVPPLTFSDIALTMSAMFEGFGMLHNVYPERTTKQLAWTGAIEPTDPDQPWGLLAIAVEGLLLNMTRPIVPERDGS